MALMKELSRGWTHSLAKAYENEHGTLPCPVATQGAHLVPPPQTPALHSPPPDISFVTTLTNRLNTLLRKQDVRIGLYGATFAEEWPISRTPRDLAEVAKARIVLASEQQLRHLEGTDSDSEDGQGTVVMSNRMTPSTLTGTRIRQDDEQTVMQLPSPLDTEADTVSHHGHSSPDSDDRDDGVPPGQHTAPIGDLPVKRPGLKRKCSQTLQDRESSIKAAKRSTGMSPTNSSKRSRQRLTSSGYVRKYQRGRNVELGNPNSCYIASIGRCT